MKFGFGWKYGVFLSNSADSDDTIYQNLHITVSTYAEILQNTCEQALMRKKVTLPLY